MEAMKPRKPVLQSVRLLDQVKERIRYLQYSLNTEKIYLYWVKFFIRWYGLRHPRDMGAQVLDIDLPWLENINRPTSPKRIPSVLARDELAGLLVQMDGITALLAQLLYGTGMRLMEGIRLRVKDVDFDRLVIIVREAKGGKDRVVMLPRTLAPALRQQMLSARAQWGRTETSFV